MLQTAIYAVCRWTARAGLHTIDTIYCARLREASPCNSGEVRSCLRSVEKLEAKVQQAIDTITLLQMEIEELKEKNNSLTQEVQSAQHQREELERENNSLKEQQSGWQERLQALLGRMEEV